jgi:hypothetical protein
MNIMKCISNNLVNSMLHTEYKEKYTEESVNTKYLRLQIDNHINWKKDKEEMIPKFKCISLQSPFHCVD